jgi:hypothetical protein
MLDHPDCEWKNSYLIYLRMKSEDELLEWKSKCVIDSKVQQSGFHEPDLDNELTAIAIYGADETIFSSLRLL